MSNPFGSHGGASRVGQTLKGKWRLDALIGSGSTASVFAATHRNGNRVAVKILHPHFAAHSDVRTRFLGEAYLANKIRHPGTVRSSKISLNGALSAFLKLAGSVTSEKFSTSPSLTIASRWTGLHI